MKVEYNLLLHMRQKVASRGTGKLSVNVLDPREIARRIPKGYRLKAQGCGAALGYK